MPDKIDFQRMSDEELAERWREATRQYVSAVNAMVERGLATGWQDMDDTPEPVDNRKPMAHAVLRAVREASGRNEENLHQRFPRAHAPFLKWIEEKCRSIPIVRWLDDGRLLIRVGTAYQRGRLFLIDDREFIPLEADVLAVGRSADRKRYAIAKTSGIEIRSGWDGDVQAKLDSPTGQEGVPSGYQMEVDERPPIITQIIPYQRGSRVALASPEGIYVIDENGADRLLPSADEYAEHFAWLENEHPGDPLSHSLSMEHIAISPDDRWIACGHQSDRHQVFDCQSLNKVAEIGHLSEYPHHAFFNQTGDLLALNSCHFYNGGTLGVPTKLLPGLDTECYEVDPRFMRLENSERVYAAVSREDEFVIGDAGGYLRAFDFEGNFRWQLFIGSSIGDIDVSADGKRLAVSTYAGFLSVIELNTGTRDPYQIGTADHIETRRYVIWKDEDDVIIW